jgi:uncharacterized protein (TIGR02996 family)
MALFLPHHGWLVTLARRANTRNNPLDEDDRRHLVDLLAKPFPEVLLAGTYDPALLRGRKQVRGIQDIWYFSAEDGVPRPEKPSGRVESAGARWALLYANREEALADLARTYPPVRLLLGLRDSPVERIRKLASVVLDGDVTTLAALAGALEEAGASEASEIRSLVRAVPAPADPEAELAEARRRVAESPCPGCRETGSRVVFRVQKEGPNKGRLFARCRECQRFDWLSDAAPAAAEDEDAELAALRERAGPCPRCGKVRQAQRVKKKGPNQGRLFLTCTDRHCDSFEWAAPTRPQGKEATQAGLVEAIREAPEDDGPRLIYADWLEEHDQPERAEFIRLQCELARTAEGPRAVELRRREQDLLAEHAAAWAANLLPLARSITFRRGMPEQVDLYLIDFRRDADKLFAAAPVRALTVHTGYGSPVLKDLVRCRHLLRLGELRLEGGPCHTAGARVLAASPDLANLTSLSLPQQDLRRPSVQVLASSPHLARLTRLDLPDNHILEGGLATLAASPHLANLTHLGLAGSRLGDEDALALAHSPHLTKLKALDVAESNFGTPALRELLGCANLAGLTALRLGGEVLGHGAAEAVVASGVLAHLRDLALLHIDHRAATLLAGPASSAGLTALRLEGNLGETGARALAESPFLKSLVSLDLSGCNLGPDGVRVLAASPNLANLTSLALAHNAIGDEGARALASSPFLGNLASLDLLGNDIGPEGTRALAQSAGLGSLASLEVRMNRLGVEGARALACSPHLGGLNYLGLGLTAVGDRGVEALVGSPYLTHLTRLDLYWAGIGSKGASLLASWPLLSRLSLLKLTTNSIGPRGIRALLQSTSLKLPSVVHLGGNDYGDDLREVLAGDRRFVLG